MGIQFDTMTFEGISQLFRQWTINACSPSAPLLPLTSFGEGSDRLYSLKGNLNDPDGPHTYLFFTEEVASGIELDWTEHDRCGDYEQGVRRWFFRRFDEAQQGPIRYGELIAIGYGVNPSFLRYGVRTFGINLDWHHNPVFEWRIGGGEPDAPVMTGDPVALFNLHELDCHRWGEPLMFFDRNSGGDIGWPTSQTFWDRATEAAKNQARELIDKASGGLLGSLVGSSDS